MANHCIFKDASGSNDGSSWTDAWTSLPATFVRGDIYYIADGNYAGYTFDDDEDGSSYISIKKAIDSDHGTDTGWDNPTMGSGQAIFYAIVFKTSYWIWNGQVGIGKTGSSYGFKIEIEPGKENGDYTLMGLIGLFPNYDLNHMEIKYTEFASLGSNYNYAHVGINSAPRNEYENTNILISNNFIHDSYSGLVIRYWNGCIIEKNYFKDTWSTAENHGQTIASGYSTGLIIRYNIVENPEGTSHFTFAKGSGGGPFWATAGEIYGNIHIGGTATGLYRCSGDENTGISNFKIYNNTIINQNGDGYGSGFYAGTGSGNEMYNNLWFNSDNPRMYGINEGAITHDFNAFFNTIPYILGEPPVEDNGQIVADVDPLVDSENEDYHLAIATNAGTTLSSPYDVDYDDVSRGGDGIWDRGAYEYVSATQSNVVLNVIIS